MVIIIFFRICYLAPVVTYRVGVLHWDLYNAKLDGLALDRKRRSMVIIMEFARGCKTHTDVKLEI